MNIIGDMIYSISTNLDAQPSARNPRETGDVFRRTGSDELHKHTYNMRTRMNHYIDMNSLTRTQNRLIENRTD